MLDPVDLLMLPAAGTGDCTRVRSDQPRGRRPRAAHQQPGAGAGPVGGEPHKSAWQAVRGSTRRAACEDVAPRLPLRLHITCTALTCAQMFLGSSSVVPEARAEWVKGAKKLLESEQVKRTTN
jgi:hypothetical protein